MSKVFFPDTFYSLAVSGKFGKPEHWGVDPYAGIYQQRYCREGKLSCKSKFYGPPPSNTPAQQVWRDKYAAGVLEYQNMSDSEKALWRVRAYGKRMSGYNLFLKNYLNNNF